MNGSSTPTLPVGPVPATKTPATYPATDPTPDADASDVEAEPAPRPGAQARVDVSDAPAAPTTPTPPKAPTPSATTPPKAPAPSATLVQPVTKPTKVEPIAKAEPVVEPIKADRSKSEPAAKPEPTTDGPVLSAAVPADEKVIGGAVGVPLAAAISPYGHRDPKVDLLPADTASGARFGLDDETPLPDGPDEVPIGGAITEPSPASASWTPPRPRAALDPLTAPYEQLKATEDREEP